jgi:hypothetical protein
MNSIKGFIGAMLITALILGMGAFIVSADAQHAMRPVYDPQGTCIVNCE